MDQYELTMAQAYHTEGANDTAHFEVTIRTLPENWGFFVMAGLAEIQAYLDNFQFTNNDIEYLRNINIFSDDFLKYLTNFKPRVKIRALPEGTIFFPNEPLLEVQGQIMDAQILETYFLNILGFSIIEASLATRVTIAAQGTPMVDFGLRRTQGPIAAVRAARAAQLAGFKATSNLFASRILNFKPSGTMAHSYIQIHDTEEEAFEQFADIYGQNAVLLVDTFDTKKGIEKAAKIAAKFLKEKNIKIRGIRIDSGDFVELSKFARTHFKDTGTDFLKILVSSNLDEYSIADMLNAGAQIDGIGIGTRFAVSQNAPSLNIVYKLIEYAGKDIYKTSPAKKTIPGRKTILRQKDTFFTNDTVLPFIDRPDDLLKPFDSPQNIDSIKNRLTEQLKKLPQPVKAIRNPKIYPVIFEF